MIIYLDHCIFTTSNKAEKYRGYVACIGFRALYVTSQCSRDLQTVVDWHILLMRFHQLATQLRPSVRFPTLGSELHARSLGIAAPCAKKKQKKA